ncbi:MAG: hypothetical protein ACREDR_47975, partial [Blastocatellia bacterium]
MSPRLPKILALSTIALFATLTVHAQKPAPSTSQSAAAQKATTVKLSAAPTDYSKQGSVIEQSRTDIRFENDGTGQEIQYAKIRIQNQQALQTWGQPIFTYSSASDK